MQSNKKGIFAGEYLLFQYLFQFYMISLSLFRIDELVSGSFRHPSQ